MPYPTLGVRADDPLGQHLTLHAEGQNRPRLPYGYANQFCVRNRVSLTRALNPVHQLSNQ